MIFYVLSIVLMVLKLVGVIAISWWIVVAPALIPLSIVLFFGLGFVVAGIVLAFKGR
jgi:hypothetical protein